ncbi:endonuclease domain-containing protein [Arthrobacter sp. 35W]|uniref:endonuclease domain-containing protein n=1 Tax=Arthrobacter sp. 35W TaxID=1132441 RepID=UPI00047A0792|nr:hypothetical protein [Arthrobacter sp. 35W]
MRRLPLLPIELASAPFTIADALAGGIPYDRLRHRQILRLSRGIATLPRRDDDDGALPLALLARPYSRVTGYSAVSHATAFRIWQLPGHLPGMDEDTIHVARQSPHGIPRRRGVTGHRLQFFDDEVECLDGLWITTRSRTWLDCSRRMTVDELTVAADHLLRIPRPEFEGRSEPYARPEDLADILDRHWGTPGIRKARLALEQARIGSDSAPETLLRLAVVRAGLPEPELNVPVPLLPGVVRLPDQSFARFKVAVEYEGSHHADPAQVERDIDREEDFAAAGWIQVRISKRHMKDDARAAVRKVRAALLQHDWTPPGPSR